MSEALQSFLRTTSSRHGPRQIALAIALGAACGLLPKLSVMFVLAFGCLLLLPVHLPLAIASCLGASLLPPSIQFVATILGTWVLTRPESARFCLEVESIPLLAWLRLNNSLILGSTLIASVSSLMVYLFSLPIARRIVAPESLKARLASSTVKASSTEQAESAPQTTAASNENHETVEPDTVIRPIQIQFDPDFDTFLRPLVSFADQPLSFSPALKIEQAVDPHPVLQSDLIGVEAEETYRSNLIAETTADVGALTTTDVSAAANVAETAGRSADQAAKVPSAEAGNIDTQSSIAAEIAKQSSEVSVASETKELAPAYNFPTVKSIDSSSKLSAEQSLRQLLNLPITAPIPAAHLDFKQVPSGDRLQPEQIIERAARTIELVGDLLSSLESVDGKSCDGKHSPTSAASQEVLRRVDFSRLEADSATNEPQRAADNSSLKAIPKFHSYEPTDSELTTKRSFHLSTSGVEVGGQEVHGFPSQPPDDRPSVELSKTSDSSTIAERPVAKVRREEALRYLLQHLKACKEKV